MNRSQGTSGGSTNACVRSTKDASFSDPGALDAPDTAHDVPLVLHREQGRHQLNAVPQILNPQVLVETVLVVVMIADRHADTRNVQDLSTLATFGCVRRRSALGSVSTTKKPCFRMCSISRSAVTDRSRNQNEQHKG
jgi:hypothetical protein